MFQGVGAADDAGVVRRTPPAALTVATAWVVKPSISDVNVLGVPAALQVPVAPVGTSKAPWSPVICAAVQPLAAAETEMLAEFSLALAA
jgi:hypothetical protein